MQYRIRHLILFLLWTSASFAVTLSVQSGQGKVGTTGNVISVVLENDVPIQGVQMKMADIPDFLIPDTLMTTDRTSEYQLSYSDTMGVLTIVLWSMSGSIVQAGEGPILDIVYTVSESARLENVQISIFQQGLYVVDAERNNLPVSINDGSFLVTHVAGSHEQPHVFDLGANYPNPFNPVTTIPFTLSQTGAVRLDIFNSVGQHIRKIIDAALPAGHHEVKWDGRDSSGRVAPAGMYLLRLRSDHAVRTRSLLLVK